jgi:2,3-bisphosphoglycerate-independent phosphoglycerate mutase
MDGVGIGDQSEADGVYQAYTPVLDGLAKTAQCMELKAHGTAVGMPTDDDMGNSEVGHNTLGCGRIFPQGAKRVNEALKSGDLVNGDTWKQVMQTGLDGGTVHFIGLLSDGNVHSHIDHLFQLLDACVEAGVPKVRVHTLLDGRDVHEKSALTYLEPLEEKLAAINESEKDYRIASGGGRMITTMDRYNADWTIVERGWKAHVLGEGRAFPSASKAVQSYYDEDPDIRDQYLDSFVVAENGNPVGTIEDGDAVVMLNFRGDRAIELSVAFEADELEHFDRKRTPDVFYAGMMQYDGDTQTPANFLVHPATVHGVLGEYFCGSGVTTFAISETQKYGHVTYFWNGNSSGYIEESLEEYVEVTSDLVPFDQRPWMKAAEITDAIIESIQSGKQKFIRVNYPNGDMVGHTGVPAAVRMSVEAVDHGLSRFLPELKKAGGMAVILADHGNADIMYTEKDGVRTPHVAHTLNPVPCLLVDYSGSNQFAYKAPGEIDTPGLSHVASTLCNLLGFRAPDDYDPSLVELK